MTRWKNTLKSSLSMKTLWSFFFHRTQKKAREICIHNRALAFLRATHSIYNYFSLSTPWGVVLCALVLMPRTPHQPPSLPSHVWRKTLLSMITQNQQKLRLFECCIWPTLFWWQLVLFSNVFTFPLLYVSTICLTSLMAKTKLITKV